MSKSEKQVRWNYKDKLFVFLFSDKANALSLYNALNGTNYSDEADLEVVTLENAIYMHQKNDVSILFADELSLWEQQSTLNFNMPLRGLLYFAKDIEGVLAKRDVNLYGKRRIIIPAPSYYVLYNGSEKADERTELKLSDSFAHPVKGFEWTATMLNINAGHNKAIMEKCPILSGYATLIGSIRDFQRKGMTIEESTDNAIRICIEQNILREFLVKHRAEVESMLITEFDDAKFEATIREEGIKEGIEEGIAIGDTRGTLRNSINVLLNMRENGFDAAQSAKISGLDADLAGFVYELADAGKSQPEILAACDSQS